MTTLLVTLLAISVSVSTAQDLGHSGVMPQAETKNSSLLIVGKSVALKECLVKAPLCSVELDLVKRISSSRSFFESLRNEVESWTGAIPDLSASWLGVLCYVRNPLRYMLVPEKSYSHELGFRTGDWFLSVDGIRSNTLQDLNIALQFPLGKTVSLLVKHSDCYYAVDFDMSGKLPWQ